jgi:hypothetical protein
LSVFSNLSFMAVSTGSRNMTPFFSALSIIALASSTLSSSSRDVPIRRSPGLEEGIGHAAAHDDGVGLVDAGW